MTNQIGIYDHTTGENIVREMTPDEQKEFDAQIALNLAEKIAKDQAIAEIEAAKTQAQAKLAALGLTIAELKALGLVEDLTEIVPGK